MSGRGALLGPEESGLANGPEGSGVGTVSSRVTVTLTLVGVVGGWGRLSPNCGGVHFLGVLFPWWVGSAVGGG